MVTKTPRIIIADTREQRPFTFARFDVEVVRTALPTGDYSLPGFEDRVAIERKSVDDLVGCLKGDQRARFERELQRGRTYDFFCVVVEASLDDVHSGRYRSEMKAEAVLQSIVAFEIRYRAPFVWCGSRVGAEYMTHSFLSKYAREIEERAKRLMKGQAA